MPFRLALVRRELPRLLTNQEDNQGQSTKQEVIEEEEKETEDEDTVTASLQILRMPRLLIATATTLLLLSQSSRSIVSLQVMLLTRKPDQPQQSRWVSRA